MVLVVDAYFASVWNRLDLVCLLSSLESAIHLTGLRHTVGPTIMTALGIARSLRPIRLVTRSGALRELVDSLVSSARNVVHVLAWLFSVYVIFAVVGNALFGGRLRLICLPYMSALYVCPIYLLMCLPYMSALYVCPTCLPYMSALYVCLICLPYMSAWYMCLAPQLTWAARSSQARCRILV